ncbi:MAG: SMC-Scp complex subunit ScpB [Verrucomicrobiales bacterium]
MDLKLVIESILFTSQKPLNLRELREILSTAADRGEDEAAGAWKKVKEEEVMAALSQLEKEHLESQRSFYLACVAGSWQFVSRPEFMPWLKAMFGVKARPPRLSQPALETLTIIAYRQPLTRAEIEQIRGVAVDGVMGTLVERGLVEQAGRAEVVGRPMTYATTPLFLEYFGLRSLNELPAADELRRIVVERPEALLTVENGSAAATTETIAADAVATNPEIPSATPQADAGPAPDTGPEIPAATELTAEPESPDLPR